MNARAADESLLGEFTRLVERIGAEASQTAVTRLVDQGLKAVALDLRQLADTIGTVAAQVEAARREMVETGRQVVHNLTQADVLGHVERVRQALEAAAASQRQLQQAARTIEQRLGEDLRPLESMLYHIQKQLDAQAEWGRKNHEGVIAQTQAAHAQQTRGQRELLDATSRLQRELQAEAATLRTQLDRSRDLIRAAVKESDEKAESRHGSLVKDVAAFWREMAEGASTLTGRTANLIDLTRAALQVLVLILVLVIAGQGALLYLFWRRFVVVTAAETMLELYQQVETAHARATRRTLQQGLRLRSQALLQVRDMVDAATGGRGTRWQPVRDAIETACGDIGRLAEDLNGLPQVFVIGVGKYGKSTLINTLLGAEVAPVDLEPKTWKIDVYDASQPVGTVRIRFRDGSTRSMVEAEARNLLEEEEEKFRLGEARANEALRQLRRQYPDPRHRQDLERKVERDHAYLSPVAEVRWPCPVNRFSRQFILVDTPGLEQGFMGHRVLADAGAFYHKSDGVLWLLDAHTLSSKANHQELIKVKEKVAEWSKATGTSNVIGVLTKIDTVRKNGSVDAVLHEAQRLFGEYFVDIVPICAVEARDAVQSQDPRMSRESGLDALVAAIERHFLTHLSRLQVESKRKNWRVAVERVGQAVATLSLTARTDDAQRRELAAALQPHLEEKVQELVGRFQQSLDALGKRVREAIYHSAESMVRDGAAWPPQRIQREALLEGELRGLLAHFSDQARSVFAHAAAHWAERSAFKEYPSLPLDLQINLPAVFMQIDDLRSTTLEVTLKQLVTSGLAGLLTALLAGGPLTLLAVPLVYWIAGEHFRSQQAMKVRRQLKAEWTSVCRQLTREVQRSLAAAAQQVQAAVDQVREGSFAELYGRPPAVAALAAAARRLTVLSGWDLPVPSVLQVILGRDMHEVAPVDV